MLQLKALRPEKYRGRFLSLAAGPEKSRRASEEAIEALQRTDGTDSIHHHENRIDGFGLALEHVSTNCCPTVR
jgi:hypothetical protein